MNNTQWVHHSIASTVSKIIDILPYDKDDIPDTNIYWTNNII